jgi:Phage portal protein, SPP1 Gp6-like
MTIMMSMGAEGMELERLRAACANRLDAQASRARWYQDYYDNEAGIIALLDTEERQTFTTFLAEAGANWCELVVNAVAERLVVTGFRFGTDAQSDAAWAIWQASAMDADHEMVQTDALVTGQSFVLVQADEDSPTGVSITPESPMQATVLYEPGTRRRRRAGFKRFHDDTEDRSTEVLILPDRIVTWYPSGGGPVIEPNPAGVVTLVELTPQPRTLKPPRSELHAAISFQDRINTTIFNRMVATDYGAFRQIWATGIKVARAVAKTDEGGEVVTVTRPFQVGADRLLTNENPEGRFGAFAEATLEGYLKSVEQDVNGLAAVTQTPPHYLLGTMVNLSADAIKAAEAGLVSKVRRRSLHLGEAWEEVMRLALQLVGNEAAVDSSAEVIWADFETRSLGQLVDALVKLETLGVPREVLWEKYGATRQEIERWEELAEAEREAAPPPPPAPPTAPQPPPQPEGAPA